MQPGSYVGKDGRTYRWRRCSADNGHIHQRLQVDGEWDDYSLVFTADWPAAKAALDALLESEEWVELEAPDGHAPYIRISPDGERVQDRDLVAGEWHDYDAWWIKAGYRAGRSVALEGVRELVEAIEQAREKSWGTSTRAGCWTSLETEDWEDIKELARKVSR